MPAASRVAPRFRVTSAAEDRPCERPERLLSSDPRCAARYEPSLHSLARVSSGRGPLPDPVSLQEPALAAPVDLHLSIEIAACGVDPVVTRDRSQSRLGRALATRGRSGGDRRSVSTDVCNPQDFFSTTRSPSRSTPNRDSHAIREPPVRSPAIRFGEPTFAGRRASDVRSIFAASGRDEPRARVSREPRAERRLRTSSSLLRPSGEEREESFCSVFNRPADASREPGPRLLRSEQRALIGVSLVGLHSRSPNALAPTRR